ncbi:MAG TPA: sulfite exporter TauE/SafE family protein [Acidimicrobiales bacterium]|nr:sulfite exporter TauE/SafE family protein [Acidimicrobiales bacterium]
MSLPAALAVVGAGLLAGTINTIVGSGSLITFPTLLALGFTPVVANVSNTVGLVPGSFSGAVAYRAELRGQRPRLIVLGTASVIGGATGALLLLNLPGSVFRHVVPALILVACALVALQPWLSARLAHRRERHAHGGPALFLSVFATGVYGGYFGAAQGVILVSLLGIFFVDHLQRLNAAKNVLALLVNGMAAALFIASTHVSWEAAGLIAAGSVAGGQIGGVVGRRLPTPLLRVVIILVGVTAAVALLV